VTTKFNNAITRGFTAIGEPSVAVCLLPGTEIAFEKDVECEPAIGIFRKRKFGQRLARFRQVNMDQPSTHRVMLIQTRADSANIVKATQMTRNLCKAVPPLFCDEH
jgi:hypothetical protein